nr:hypothetical protein [Tanacetum cinerariifolium]
MLLFNNSSPRPPEEFVSKNYNADIDSFSPSPIPVEDSDSLMKEIDLFLTLDDPMPPSIEEDDDDSERDIPILEEFKLTLLKSIPPRIDETDCDPEEEIRLIEKLLYDNSSPRPPKEFNSDVIIDSFSPSPIPVEDSDSLMEEIDLSFTSDYPMPSGIEEDDYDSERDILILKELLSNNFLLLPENESFHFDIPPSFRPPAKPPDGHKGFQPSAECPMMIHEKNTPILDVPLFHFYPLDQFKYGEIGSSSAT